MTLKTIGKSLTEEEVAAGYLPWRLELLSWIDRAENTTQAGRHEQLKLKAAKAIAEDVARRAAALITP